MDIMYQVKNKRLHLSRMVECQFNNLNASFKKLVGTRERKSWSIQMPIDIRSIDDVNKFKSKLKTFLFKRVYELS